MELILNRPVQSNGFTAGMYQRFTDLIKKAEKDDKIDCLLIKANGKNFSSGNDLNNYSGIDFNNKEELNERI
jgi:trans-2-decenoyl-[acyl-carrier protein] isomerase